MAPNRNDNPQSVVNKLRFIWLFPVTVIGLCLLILLARLDWNQWFAEDLGPKQNPRPAPKSVGGGNATVPKNVTPGIFGKVRLQGTPPSERLLPLDPACAKLYATPPTTRFYLVGNHGELADVFVYIKSGLEGKDFAIPTQPVVLKIAGCVYEPYISGVQTGQRLLVQNSDPFLHNTHTMPNVRGNHESSKAPLPNIDTEFAFDHRDVFVKFKCDVHPWEYGYVGVVEHPYFAVTDAAGAFTFPNVPPGKYLIEAVHRKAGKQTREITLGANESQTADFVFDLNAQAANPPTDPDPLPASAAPMNAIAERPVTAAAPAPPPATAGALPQPTSGPRIFGRARLQGIPPPEKLLPLDVNCGRLNTHAPTTRFYLVNEEGGLADVFVYIRSGLEGKSFTVPTQPVWLDQVGCEYAPYVLGLQTRQQLVVRNSDPFFHNVHPMPVVAGNLESNKVQLPKVDLTFGFEQPELFLKFKCDIHPWMFAYVCVLDHPYFAVTDKTGAFTLPNLPPGKYVIEAVHRKAGTLTQEITIGTEDSRTADFIFVVK